MALQRMASEPGGHTLQPTALVHEAWLSLEDSPSQSWQNRAHFFGAAAEAMRRILIARARRKGRQRRGAGAEHLDADSLEISSPMPEDELLALDEALERFAAQHPKQAELVKLRYFVGMTIEDASAIVGVSQATAKVGLFSILVIQRNPSGLKPLWGFPASEFSRCGEVGSRKGRRRRSVPADRIV
jgi:RNA polymerase sigma factor (TIGR02999 family)